MLTGILLAAVIVIISRKFDLLTNNGTFLAFILGSLIFGLGGLPWSIPIILFFTSSSLLTKLRERLNKESLEYFIKGSRRDYKQVLSNGGLGGLLVVFYTLTNNEEYYLIYLASIASVNADTWATEIGTMRKRITYNILNLKRIEQGLSGGISVIGLLGSFLGAMLIASAVFLFIGFNIIIFVFIITSGIIASMFDSFLGATFQAKYKCNNCSKIIENSLHCNKQSVIISGNKLITNDTVNFLASISGSIIMFLLINLFRKLI